MTSVLGQPHFRLPVLLRDDAAVGALAAGGGNGQHRAHRQRALDFGLAGEEVPEITVVGDAHADGLGGVDDAAAANGQQEVRALLPGQVNAFIHLAAAGIGLDAPQLAPGNARFFQGGGGGVVSAVFPHGAAACHQQHLAAAELAHQCAYAAGLALPKGEESGGIERKVVHN